MKRAPQGGKVTEERHPQPNESVDARNKSTRCGGVGEPLFWWCAHKWTQSWFTY